MWKEAGSLSHHLEASGLPIRKIHVGHCVSEKQTCIMSKSLHLGDFKRAASVIPME